MATNDSAPLYNKLPKDTRRIRLLTILPNADESAIVECTLTETDLDDDQTTYDALSYRWGDRNATTPIIVNGYTKEITINLYDALHQFRANSHPRPMVLWADALCINQKDCEERGHQVQLMGSIYRKASTVHAWLGQGGSQMKRGLDAIERLSMCECKGTLSAKCESDDRYNGTQYDINYPDLHLVALVCQSSYWKRLWVTQELALNNNVYLHCGNHRSRLECWQKLVLRDGLYRFRPDLYQRNYPLIYVDSSHGVVERFATDMVHFDKMRPMTGECLSAREGRDRILKSFVPFLTAKRALKQRNAEFNAWRAELVREIASLGHLETWDPRDHIYGILGLFGNQLDISPDYIHRTPEQVFIDTALQVMRVSGSVDILLYAACKSGAIASWSPDFRVEQPTVWQSYEYWEEMFYCKKLPPPKLGVTSPKQGVLKIEALVFDSIRSLQPPPPIGLRKQVIKSTLNSSIAHPCTTIIQYPHGPDFRRCWELAYSKVFFSTAKGYIGMMGNYEPLAGDLICVFLLPATRLFCLRPVESKIELAYTLVGHCAIWKEYDSETAVSPLGAIREVAETRFGGNWSAEGLFHPVLLV